MYKLLYFNSLCYLRKSHCETISIQLQKMCFSKLDCLTKNQNFAAKVQKNLHMSKFYTIFAGRKIHNETKNCGIKLKC